MIKIGILGDIGSGKSYVAKLFGYPVFNADKEVSKIYKKNKFFFRTVKKILPNYISSFPVKKKELSNAILNNKKNLKKINEIIHPIIIKKIKKFLKKNKSKKFVVLDIPLLLENKINNKKFILVFIDAKKKEINKRLKKRFNYNKKLFDKLRNLQLPLEIKRKNCDYLIKNNFKSISIKSNIKILKKKILVNERNSS